MNIVSLSSRATAMLTVTLGIGAIALVAGCEKSAEDSIEDAADSVGDAVEDAGDAVGDAVKKIGD